MAEKVGVYVCHCGSNIAGKVDVEDVARWAGERVQDVAVSRDYKFMCSALGQKLVEDDLKMNVDKGLATKSRENAQKTANPGVGRGPASREVQAASSQGCWWYLRLLLAMARLCPFEISTFLVRCSSVPPRKLATDLT